MIIYFLFNADSLIDSSAFGLWLVGVIVVNSISLVVDTVDVVRHVNGDRREIAEGL